jgi:hypothetical protein
MRNWLSDALPLGIWLLYYLTASLCAGFIAFKIFGNRLISGAVFMAFLITSWFQDPPAL